MVMMNKLKIRSNGFPYAKTIKEIEYKYDDGMYSNVSKSLQYYYDIFGFTNPLKSLKYFNHKNSSYKFQFTNDVDTTSLEFKHFINFILCFDIEFYLQLTIFINDYLIYDDEVRFDNQYNNLLKK